MRKSGRKRKGGGRLNTKEQQQGKLSCQETFVCSHGGGQKRLEPIPLVGKTQTEKRNVGQKLAQEGSKILEDTQPVVGPDVFPKPGRGSRTGKYGG